MSRRVVKRTAGTSNRKEAERRAHKWEAELNEGRYHAPSKTTWEEFRQRYEAEYLIDRAPETRRRAAGVFNMVEDVLRPQRLRDITADRLSHYAAELRRSGRSANTIGCHMAHIKAALRWAARLGMLVEVPAVESTRRAKMKGRPISDEEFGRMLRAVPDVVGAASEALWCRLLRGLWLSGLSD